MLRLIPTELEWKETWRGTSVSHSVKTKEIEDLELERRGVLLLTGTESFQLATGANEPYRRWLVSALKSHLAAAHLDDI